MKKILFFMLASGLMLYSCENSKKEKEEIQALEQEANAIDSVSVEMQKSKDSIEKNVQELDSLLNDLN